MNKKLSLLLLLIILITAMPAALAEQTLIKTSVPNQHTLTLSYGEGGTVTVNGTKLTGGTSITIDRHERVVIDIMPEEGFSLQTVSASSDYGVSLQGNSVVIARMVQDLTMRIDFQQEYNRYAVTVQNGTGAGAYLKGTAVTITADPDTTVEVFDHWAIEGVAISEEELTKRSLTFEMPDNPVMAEAIFAPKNIPVVLDGTDTRITYNGSTFDVNSMFTIDPNAGTACYEIDAGGTGEGTLNGSELTITKAGTFAVKLTTEMNGAYAAGEATAMLTVDKGTPVVTVPTELIAVYSQTLSQLTLPTELHGAWSWQSEEELVGDVGEQVHKAVFTPNDLNLWNTVTKDVAVLVRQSSTELEGEGLNHADGKYVYGEDIVVVLQAKASGNEKSLERLFGYPESRQIALYKRVKGQPDEQITQPVSEANGQYVLSLRTEDKLLAIGKHTLVAKYVGDANTADTETVYTVTIAPKQLTLTDVIARNRYYRDGDAIVDVTSAKIIGLEADKDGTDDVQLAANLTGMLSSDEVGMYTSVVLVAPVLTGTDIAWYTMENTEYATNVSIMAIPADGLYLRVSVNTIYTDADVQKTDLGKIPELDTVEEIDAQLRINVAQKGAHMENAVLYDLILEYLDADGKWKYAEKEHFPTSGVEIILPVIKGTTPVTHAYTVVHMFAKNMDDHKAGEVEYPVPTVYQNEKGEWMLKFTVTGMSPMMVAAAPIPSTDVLPQTGDYSNAMLYAMLLSISMISLVAAKKRRTE